MEWMRAKYSLPVRKFLKLAEKLAIYSSRYYVADSPVIKNYLDSAYRINCRYIAYGATQDQMVNEEILVDYGIQKYKYFLLMARMEPENNIEMILDGYCQTTLETPFIVIGNTSNKYGRSLVCKYQYEKRIVFLGPIFDEHRVGTITSCCSIYFHGHSVGGTNPSLLAAMAMKAPLAIHNNAFNRAVVKDNALAFNNATEVRELLLAGQFVNTTHIENNYNCISREYSWKKITEQYENYFIECWRAGNSPLPLNYERNILFKR